MAPVEPREPFDIEDLVDISMYMSWGSDGLMLLYHVFRVEMPWDSMTPWIDLAPDLLLTIVDVFEYLEYESFLPEENYKKIEQWKGEMWFAEYTQRLAYSILLVPFIGDPLDGGGIPLLNNDAEYSLIIPHDF